MRSFAISDSNGCVWHSVFSIFFFQAEDGIRDLVRSRGLGDVYKRQALPLARGGPEMIDILLRRPGVLFGLVIEQRTHHILSLIHI